VARPHDESASRVQAKKMPKLTGKAAEAAEPSTDPSRPVIHKPRT
jgi:hypothetical protein